MRLGGVDVRELRAGRRSAVASPSSPRTSSCSTRRCATTSPCSAPGPPTDERLRAVLDDVGLGRVARGAARRARQPPRAAAAVCRPARASCSRSPAPSSPSPTSSCSTRRRAGSTRYTEARIAAATARAARRSVGARSSPTGSSTLDEVDEIVVLDDGAIVEHGRRVELAADPTEPLRARLAACSSTVVATASLPVDEVASVAQRARPSDRRRRERRVALRGIAAQRTGRLRHRAGGRGSLFHLMPIAIGLVLKVRPRSHRRRRRLGGVDRAGGPHRPRGRTVVACSCSPPGSGTAPGSAG